MAILWWDGFDQYPDDADVRAVPAYSLSSTSMDTHGTLINQRFGVGRCIDCNMGSPADSLVFTFPAAIVGCTVGFAYNDLATAFLASPGSVIMRLRNGGTALINLQIDNTGTIHITNAASAILASSAAGLVSSNAWHYYEVEAVRDAAAGQVRVWLDGVQIINATGLNTGAVNFDRMIWYTWAANVSLLYDDFYFGNTATDHLGDVRVDTLYANADTVEKDFSRSAGADNYLLVDEAFWDADTTYVFSSTVGHLDLYEFGNLAVTPSQIHGVKVRTVAKKDDATVREIRTQLKSGATTANGATFTLGTSYTIKDDYYMTDPNTTAAWTAAAVNALQVGPEIIT